MSMPNSDSLFGHLALQLGVPAAQAVRRVGAPDLQPLWRGQHPSALPERVALVHALCGAAHRVAARLAVSAAQGETQVHATAAEREALRWQTARDQLQRLLLDPRWKHTDLPPRAGG